MTSCGIHQPVELILKSHLKFNLFWERPPLNIYDESWRRRETGEFRLVLPYFEFHHWDMLGLKNTSIDRAQLLIGENDYIAFSSLSLR